MTTDSPIRIGAIFEPRYEGGGHRTLRVLADLGSNRYLTQSLGTGRRRETSLATLLGAYIESSPSHESNHAMSTTSVDALRIEALHAALGTTSAGASGTVDVAQVVQNAETYLAFLTDGGNA